MRNRILTVFGVAAFASLVACSTVATLGTDANTALNEGSKSLRRRNESRRHCSFDLGAGCTVRGCVVPDLRFHCLFGAEPLLRGVIAGAHTDNLYLDLGTALVFSIPAFVIPLGSDGNQTKSLSGE